MRVARSYSSCASSDVPWLSRSLILVSSLPAKLRSRSSHLTCIHDMFFLVLAVGTELRPVGALTVEQHLLRQGRVRFRRFRQRVVIQVRHRLFQLLSNLGVLGLDVGPDWLPQLARLPRRVIPAPLQLGQLFAVPFANRVTLLIDVVLQLRRSLIDAPPQSRIPLGRHRSVHPPLHLATPVP